MELREILERFKKGELNLEEALREIKLSELVKIENLSVLDVGREERCGIPEVVYAEFKKTEDLLRIAQRIIEEKGRVILSRVTKEQLRELKDFSSKKKFSMKGERTLVISNKNSRKKGKRKLGILTAGTSDIPVAEDAKLIAEEMGVQVLSYYDVGVAGLHRLFEPLRIFLEEKVDAIIVVAGMEGSLPSVVASLVDVPVIGVPTSVGYGVGEGGFSALFSMLQSCSPGLSVVNIDNGFGAGVFGALICKRIERELEYTKTSFSE
ncbi:MAG: nickel pincer cofactor biosynthesis protein LarB [Candidatus Methanofastidiosia archaeon]